MNDNTPTTDLEDLLNKRVNAKFQKFTDDVLEQHNITQKKLEEMMTFMYRHQYNGLHITVLYILSFLSIVGVCVALFGG